jgi:Protein of unknown function (DUF3105)
MRKRPLLGCWFACVVIAGAAACGSGGASDGGDTAGGDTHQTELGAVSGGKPLGPANEGIDGVEAFRVESHTHSDEPLVYDHRPPVGGAHFPTPATCGFYSGNPPPDSLLVHDLEHGAIWIAYDPGLDQAQLAVLRRLVANQPKVTVAPYEGLDSPLVVSAWARQLRLEDANDPRLLAFTEQYRDGPQAPEAGGVCRGLGEPDIVSPAG